MPDREAVPRFVERFAAALTDAGMPRMPARAFVALLVTDSGRLTAVELADQLHSSAGAISGAVRYLTQTQLVDRERVPGSRKDHYRVRDDVWHVATARRDAIIRAGGDDEARRHREPGADQLAQVGALAARDRDVPPAQIGEAHDVRHDPHPPSDRYSCQRSTSAGISFCMKAKNACVSASRAPAGVSGPTAAIPSSNAAAHRRR